MGTGAGGNFGNTKGKSQILYSSKDSNVLSLSLVSNASGKVKNIADNSPINIPRTATYKEQDKNGYTQIKFSFERNGVKYESRWHTKTPNSPLETGNTYQVTKTIPGGGYGKKASQKELFHLIKYPSGRTKWVSHSKYQDALRNIKNGTATQKEKEIIKYGHIK